MSCQLNDGFLENLSFFNVSYKFKVSDASIDSHVSSREQLWCKSEQVQVWDLRILD